MNELLIGCHVSLNAPDFYLGTVKEALSYGATTFMFYTGAPQNSYRRDIKEMKIDEGRELLKANGIDESKIVIHAPYIVNLANDTDKNKHEKAKEFILNELIRCQAFNVKTMVLHPGAHVNLGVERGLNNIIKSLDDIFDNLPNENKVNIALETMAGKGSELGTSFEQIAFMIKNSKHQDRLGVCLDTCHISDAGYDIFDENKIIEEFDKIIGLDKLLVIHVNDSKNPRGAHKDRHENIGYGEIGYDALSKFVLDKRLSNIPKILETPYVNGKPPYKTEIDMFKNNKFEKDWKNQFI